MTLITRCGALMEVFCLKPIVSQNDVADILDEPDEKVRTTVCYKTLSSTFKNTKITIGKAPTSTKSVLPTDSSEISHLHNYRCPSLIGVSPHHCPSPHRG